MKTIELLKKLANLPASVRETLPKASRDTTWFEVFDVLEEIVPCVLKETKSGKHCVYVYVDPRDDVPFYVGVTNNLKRREGFHKRCKAKQHFHCKLRRLESEGVAVTAIPIAINLSREEAYRDYEPFFISVIGRQDKKTGPLCNQTSGGEGFFELGRRARENQRNGIRKKYDDPEYRKRHRLGIQKKQDEPEHHEKVLAGACKRSKSKTWRDNQLAGSRAAVKRRCNNEAVQKRRRHAPPKNGQEFKGVYKKHNKWYTKMIVDGIEHVRYGFATEIEAAHAYNDLVRDYQDGDGWLNRVSKMPIEVERRRHHV